MKRALIVDDEEPARYELDHYLKKTNFFDEIHQAENAADALKKISAHDYCVIFLDINMPGMNGIELANILNSIKNINIVFITAYNEYAVEAFKVAAVDYILKPIDFNRLLDSIKRIESNIQKNIPSKNITALLETFQYQKIIGKKRGSNEKVFLDVRSIVYFKSADTDCYAFDDNDERWVVGGTIKGYESQLSSDFIQIHRAYLVNIHKIKSCHYFLAGTYKIKLDGLKEKLTVSRAYAKQFKERFNI